MYGEDGWCRSCGAPLREQVGSLVLQRRVMAQVAGAWVPNWRFDVFCVDDVLAERIRASFSADLLPVGWRGDPPGGAWQIVIPVVGSGWVDPEAISAAAATRHATSGESCRACGRWRWMPVDLEELPPPVPEVLRAESDVIASPEWFGAGAKAFRHVLFRRELAELIAAESPRDFTVVELSGR